MARNVSVTVGTIPPPNVTIAEENALTGDASGWSINLAGDLDNQGFARQFSVNVGETVQFSCHGTGTVLDIYRIGYYAGNGWRKVATLTNTATSQPNPTTVSNTNGGTTCTAWSVTASWAVPALAVSGLYVGVIRNTGGAADSWIPFVVRDDARIADVVVKISDTTWGIAYNYYGTPANPVAGGGRSFYGEDQLFDTQENRAHFQTYHKPIITRHNRNQTYWLACEAPMIRWLERNGYNIKYVSSRDLDRTPTCIDNADIFVSSGHDEYWSQTMRDKVEARRDEGMHLLFFSGNEVYWRCRFDGDNNVYCYKDTAAGPGAHTAGTALDPVTWTGTWRDTRSANTATRDDENNLTGTYFRMNGINDKTVTFDGQAGYASHPVWRNTVVASGTDVTVTGIVGFEADDMVPTRPSPVTLAAQTFNIDGSRANDNGDNYGGLGNLVWGIVSQRWPSGAVVVGFGTNQWAWGLDAVHDRGANYANTTMQQFTYNLLRDLGAAPATLMGGITASSPEALTNYGSTAA